MIINNLNAIVSAYMALRSNNLVRSKADFSKWYLAKGDSYLRSMQARSRNVPDATAAMLQWSLQREIVNFSLNPHLGQPYAIALNAAYDCLQQELAAIGSHRQAMRQWSLRLPANSNDDDNPPAEGPKASLANATRNLQS